MLIYARSYQKLLGSTLTACLPDSTPTQSYGAHLHAHLNGLPCRVLHRSLNWKCGLRQLKRLRRRVHSHTVQACEEVCWQGSTG